MKALIIEDDESMRKVLCLRLPTYGFAVDTAADGATGLALARMNRYDIILLDLNLPDMPGEWVVEAVRGHEWVPPILMLSVIVNASVKARLLNAGADDYLGKPFEFDELIARMRALLRRPQRVMPPVLSLGDLVFDTAKQEVERGGKPVALTRIELALLELLLRDAGSVITRDTLIEHVWNSSVDPFSNALETHMYNLRKKLGEPLLINTVHGHGYRIG